MASSRRASNTPGLPDARQGAVILASSAAAAAAVTVTHRRRARQRAEQERRYVIEPGPGAGRELRRIASGQLGHALAQLEETPASPKGVHEARKSLKRSRSLLRVTRDLLGRDVYQKENGNLRDAGRALSDTRDSQVLLETMENLGANGALSEESRNRLRQALEQPPSEEHQDGQTAAVAAISETRSRVADWPLPPNGEVDILAPGIERMYRQGRRALKHVGKDEDDERWHDLRKRSKDLWYASQLLRAARTDHAAKVTKRAHRLADLLGDDHDLAILGERLQDAQLDPKDLAAVTRLIRRRRAKLHRKATRIAERLYRRKPRKFLRKLGLA